MKIRNEIAVIGIMFILSVAASNAMASTIVAGYDLAGAIVDPLYYGGGGGHAVVIGGERYYFGANQGSLMEYENDDGTTFAVLTGYAGQGSADSLNGYAVNIILHGRTTIAPPGSPKKELLSSAYIENGGPVDAATWSYYTSFAGTFEGVGLLAGSVLDITQRGPAFQMGVGADNKNIEFGASAWFWAEDEDHNTQVGDFNLELRVVPIPAALQLMISGLVALGFAGGRRQNAKTA